MRKSAFISFLTYLFFAQAIKEVYSSNPIATETKDATPENSSLFLNVSTEPPETIKQTKLRASDTTRNVVLFIVDDYGKDNSRSINSAHAVFDWAKRNTVRLSRLSSGVPVCAPSRDEMFTGRTAARLGGITFDSNGLNVVIKAGGRTLPGEFASEGYTTTSRGKSIHPNRESAMNAWKEYTLGSISNTDGANAECKRRKIACIRENTLDRKTRNEANGLLAKFAQSKEKFFLVIGFNRPHLPWTTTQANFKQASSEIPLENTKVQVTPSLIQQLQATKDISLPIRVPEMNGVSTRMNIHNFFASARIGALSVPIKGSKGKTWKLLSDLSGGFANQSIDFGLLVKYQRASLKTTLDYIDSVLQQIYKLGLDKNTIIVITGDHGIGINQMAFDVNGNPIEGFLSKNRLYSQISDIEGIFYVPGITDVNPGVADVPATSVDLFTTIISLALNRAPKSSTLKIDGKDLSPWIKNPSLGSTGMYKVIQYPRGPRWQPQEDPLMAGDQCSLNQPQGGRQEWCNMEYKITQVINGKEYQLFASAPFYEQRTCANAGPTVFEPGEKYWQITTGSCVDFNAADDLMLFSNDPNDLGKNLLFGVPTAANKKIASDLLGTLQTARAYERCAIVPKRRTNSICIR